MSTKKEFQNKANALLEQYPTESKVIIVENGQCFFDELSAGTYHQTMDFDSDPQVFFREGFESTDETDLLEALELAQVKILQKETLLEDISEALDLDLDYKPVDQHTPEIIAQVIGLREKYMLKEQLLTEANLSIEKLSTLTEENKTLKDELEAATKQIEAFKSDLKNTKNKQNAAQTDSTEA